MWHTRFSDADQPVEPPLNTEAGAIDRERELAKSVGLALPAGVCEHVL